jgi:tetratricopeptide (TPR) repeat protein
MITFFNFTQNTLKLLTLTSIIFLTSCSLTVPSLRLPFLESEEALVLEKTKEIVEDTKRTMPKSDEEWEAALFQKADEDSRAQTTFDKETVAIEEDEKRKLNPAIQSLSRIASQAFNQGNWDLAQSTLERAIKIEPSNGALWRQLSYTHMRAGNYEQALAHAQRSVLLSNDSERQMSAGLLDKILKRIADN